MPLEVVTRSHRKKVKLDKDDEEDDDEDDEKT